MNAAGTLGFVPDPRGAVDLSLLGAFITNPISLTPRTPAQERTCLPYPGGFLLHTGYPNPGIRAALKRFAQRWERSACPVIVHILAGHGEEVYQIVRQIERLENLAGVEVGVPPEAAPALVAELVSAGFGERPVIASLPIERILELAPAALAAGAAAVSLGASRVSAGLCGKNGARQVIWTGFIPPGIRSCPASSPARSPRDRRRGRLPASAGKCHAASRRHRRAVGCRAVERRV